MGQASSDGERRELVMDAIAAGESIRVTSRPVSVPACCASTWQRLSPDLVSFLEKHGEVRFESGGSLGGSISFARDNRFVTRAIGKYPFLSDALIVGSDEAEIVMCLPDKEEVFSLITLTGNVGSFPTFYEYLCSTIGLEQAEGE